MQTDIAAVFDGGGAKMLAFVGCLHALETQNIQIRSYYGSSAGAIFSSLCAIGYTADELYTMLKTMDFSSFFHVNTRNELLQLIPAHRSKWASIVNVERQHEVNILLRFLLFFKQFRMLYSYSELGGVYSTNQFSHWLAQMFERKYVGSSAWSFQQLQEKTKKSLHVGVTNVEKIAFEFLSHETTPHVNVIDAVTHSMRIPFVFQNGRLLCNGEDKKLIDGGVLNNFCFFEAEHNEPLLPVWGFLLDEERNSELFDDISSNVIPMNKTSLFIKKLQTNAYFDFFMQLLFEQQKKRESSLHDKQCIRIPCKNYGTLEFSMSEKRRTELYNLGWRHTLTKMNFR